MARPKTANRPILEKAFARRFEEACNLSSHVPEYNFGRLRYIQDELAKLGVQTSRETIRKWYAGEARPRPDKMRMLARVLQVDEAWLSLGQKPTMAPEKTQLANVEGAANIVAGVFAVNGASYAWPSKREESFHFFTIMNGRQYSVFVASGTPSKGEMHFAIPNEYSERLIVGFVRRAPFKFDLYRFDSEIIAAVGQPKGGYIEMIVKDHGSDLSVAGRTIRPVAGIEELAS